MPKNFVFLSSPNRLKIYPWRTPGSPQAYRRTGLADPWSKGGGHLSKKSMNRRKNNDSGRSDTPLGRRPSEFNLFVAHSRCVQMQLLKRHGAIGIIAYENYARLGYINVTRVKTLQRPKTFNHIFTIFQCLGKQFSVGPLLVLNRK